MEEASELHIQHNKTSTISLDSKRMRLKSSFKLLIVASLLIYNALGTDASDSEATNDNKNFTSRSVDSSISSPLIFTSSNDGNANNTYSVVDDNQTAKTAVWLSNSLSEALSTYVPSSSTIPDSKCTADGLLYKRHLENLTFWAVQMYDASVHFPEGVLAADTYQLGHFDECLNVSYPSHNIQGRYCLATLLYAPSQQLHSRYYEPPAKAYYHDPPPHSSVWDYLKRTLDPRMKPRDEIHFAVCVPASCTREDVQASLNAAVISALNKNSLTGRLNIDEESCYVKERPYDTGFYAMIVIIIVLFGLSFIGTLYDYLIVRKRTDSASHHPGDMEQVILSFSIRANAQELFQSGDCPELDTLNGAKVVTMFFIALGHRYLYTLGSATYNPIRWEEKITSFTDMFFTTGTHIVDIFFFCGGFLTFYSLNKEFERKKKFNFLTTIILRYCRMVPAYIFMIGIYSFVLVHLGNGPLWNLKVGLESKNCRENWWLNMLFVDNFINTERGCLLMSWYFACDMHFFIIGSFIVYYLWKNPKIGEILCIIGLILSIAGPFIITYIGNFDAKIRMYQSLLYNPHMDKYFNTVYIKTYVRGIPYIMGLASAYICMKMKRLKITVPVFWQFIGAWSFVLAYAFQMYGLVIYTPGRPYSALEHATLATILPLTWSIAVTWISLVQYTTGNSLYNFFFVKQIYGPLSKLIYCIVLIHPAVQLVQSSSNRNPEYLTLPKLFWMTFGDFSLSYFPAVIMHLVLEAPLRSVAKLCIQGTRKKKVD